jgi:hypothetical protein
MGQRFLEASGLRFSTERQLRKIIALDGGLLSKISTVMDQLTSRFGTNFLLLRNSYLFQIYKKSERHLALARVCLGGNAEDIRTLVNVVETVRF